MHLTRAARMLLGASSTLTCLSVVAVAAAPNPAPIVQAVPRPSTTVGPDPTTTSTTTSTTAPPTTTTAAPPRITAVTTTPAPSPRPTAMPAVPVARSSGSGRASCGWGWDATHFDDGSRNEVTLSLNAPREPSQPVTITLKPGASAPIALMTVTDGNGDATATFALSNDKRDWTVTIGALFAGSACPTQTFTISYL